MADTATKLNLTQYAQTKGERAILKVIEFWYPKAKTERDGHVWLIQTAEEFRAHGCDLADKTIWNLISHLRRRGVLLTERHRHPYRHNLGPVLWIRLGNSVLPEMGSTDCPDQEVGTAQNGKYIKQEVISSSQGAITPATEESCAEAGSSTPQEEEGNASVSSDHDDKPTKGQPGYGASMLKNKSAGASIASALALGKVKKASAHASKPLSPQVLFDAFCDAYRLEYKITPCSWNMARAGMSKKIMMRLRDEGATDHQILDFVFGIVSGWGAFCADAKITHNLTIKGERPNIGDLCKHALEAYGYWIEHGGSGAAHGTHVTEDQKSETSVTATTPSAADAFLSGDFE